MACMAVSQQMLLNLPKVFRKYMQCDCSAVGLSDRRDSDFCQQREQADFPVLVSSCMLVSPRWSEQMYAMYLL